MRFFFIKLGKFGLRKLGVWEKFLLATVNNGHIELPKNFEVLDAKVLELSIWNLDLKVDSLK